jgi:hypothetical protein
MNIERNRNLVIMLEEAERFLLCSDTGKQEQLWECAGDCNNCKARQIIDRVIQELEG